MNLKSLVAALILISCGCITARADTSIGLGFSTYDAYFSPKGTDVAGNTIGSNCTISAPCQTPAKALTFIAANVTLNANRSYNIGFDGGNGPFYLTTTLLYTTAHTVNKPYTVTFGVYNGSQAVFSGGLDTTGTWSATTLPNGTAACVSNYYAAAAPLTEGLANLYVGRAWINGHPVSRVQNPRSGLAWAQVPGTQGGAAVGSSAFAGTTAAFTNTSANITIADESQVGVVGTTISFETTGNGFNGNRPYWIIAKNTGTGVIQVSSSPGGSAQAATGSTTLNVADPVKDINAGDRGSISSQNVFPYDATNAPFNTSLNQKDVVGELAYPPNYAPVSSVNTGTGTVTLNSRMLKVGTIYPKQGYRVINRFEDLGTGGWTGELYHNRTTGLLYYTPRLDLNETCASINLPGQSIIPGNLEVLLRISNSAADVAIAGGTTGQPVGNLQINNIAFEHTNSSFLTGWHNIDGAVGGGVSSDPGRIAGGLDWAVELVGASNVILGANGKNNTFAHLSGSAIGVSWGSNIDTIQYNIFSDIGGSAINSGVYLNAEDQYHFETDPGYYGTTTFGPSTTSFNTGTNANPDFTGLSDASILIQQNKITDVAQVFSGSSAVGISGWQQDKLLNNQIIGFSGFGLMTSTSGLNTTTAPFFNPPLVSGTTVAAVNYYPNWGNTVQLNEIASGGYETTTAYNSTLHAGQHVPGFAGNSDYGLFYLRGAQDYDGSGSKAGTFVNQNEIHDISAGCFPYTVGGTYLPTGKDAQIIYYDGNNSNGVVTTFNSLYNRSAAAVGYTTCPVRATQWTGGMRSDFHDNIISMVLPSGYTTSNPDGNSYYTMRADVGPFNNYWVTSQVYSANATVFNSGQVYTTSAGGTAGASPPTCTSGTCSDGGVTWTWIEALPTGTVGFYGRLDYSNITSWTVTGGGTSGDWPVLTNGIPFANGAQFVQNGGTGKGNIYSQIGQTLTKYTGNVTFAAWLATAGGQSSTQDVNSLYGGAVSPDAAGIIANFVDSTVGNFAFNVSDAGPGTGASCAGLWAGTTSPACGTNINMQPWNITGAGPTW